MFLIKDMGWHAGSMRNGASSGAETIQVNREVLEYQIQGNTLLLRRKYATIAYVRDNAVCRMPYEMCRTRVRILSNNLGRTP